MSSYSPKASNENAERLKAQGNALHVRGQYRAAYQKYSEAIREDPMNAVYWANRAASGLAMKEYVISGHFHHARCSMACRYLDACHDAERVCFSFSNTDDVFILSKGHRTGPRICGRMGSDGNCSSGTKHLLTCTAIGIETSPTTGTFFLAYIHKSMEGRIGLFTLRREIDIRAESSEVANGIRVGQSPRIEE